ncbi:MAG: carboxymuconolactone decarboxylase family protein [Polyangiaceae bacterium]
MARVPYAPAGNPGSDHPLNLFRMLAHSPPVMSGFAKLGGALLQDAALDPRLREIAIVRIGLLAGASYEVEKHTAIARAVGLTGGEIAALRPGESRASLSDAARAVIDLADELFDRARATDAVLTRVRQHLDDRQLVELVVAIGYYGLVCRVLETLGVDREVTP